ncbi:MAG: response regulator [Arcobacteraceae bacterium]|nr:response regulator [Arcobacteraceae bacterium]
MIINILFLTSDDDYILDFIKYALEDLLPNTEVNLFGAHSEERAYELLQQENIKLIIADMDICTIESYEFYDDLKKKNYSTIPFVFLSSDIENQEFSMLKGIENFFLKPLSEKNLIEKINTILNTTSPCSQNNKNKILQEIDELSLNIESHLLEAKRLTALLRKKADSLNTNSTDE